MFKKLAKKLKKYRVPLVSLLLGCWLAGQMPGVMAFAGRSSTLARYPLPTTHHPLPTTLLAQANPQNQSVDDLKKKQEAIDDQREEITEERQRIENLEDAAEQRLDGLQDTIQTTSYRIEETEYRIQRSEQELKALETKLIRAQQEYDQVRTAAVGRLQFMQRQQSSEGWAVLLQSKDLNEFLDRRYQLKRVYESDRAFLSDLKARSDELVRQQQSVEAQKNSIALLRQQLLAQRDQFSAQAQQQTQLIGRLQENRSALQAAEAQLAKDSESLGTLIRQKVAATTGGIVGTGQMIFPTAGSITSRFGTRIHPVLGYRRFHAGVDFGASHGTTITAADSGQVIFSGWYGGYGNAVIVDHGGGLTSLYGHASKLLVSEGQSVQQGQAIAKVGSTGLSTGPHLHFEVRRNGSPVNPMEFL
ncbi:MAG: peptidoglycan DD-metalloendopeptidase family protein [Cyanobacteria bacterium P01_D01_bin.44]